MTSSGQVARESFRIRVSPRSRRFFIVHVAADVRALRLELRRCGIRHTRTTAGCCIGATGTGRYRHLVGLVFVPRPHVGAGFVAHELAHAGFRAVEREGLVVRHDGTAPSVKGWAGEGSRWADHSEERYCEVVEHLNKDFWRQWHRYGYDRA